MYWQNPFACISTTILSIGCCFCYAFEYNRNKGNVVAPIGQPENMKMNAANLNKRCIWRRVFLAYITLRLLA